MFRSHKVSTVSGYNYVLPCSNRKAVPVNIRMFAGDPAADPLCQQYSTAMSTVQNSLLSYLVDLLSGKNSPQDTVTNLNGLEQQLMLNCAAIARTNTNANCC
jgi:hypothetical protein